MRFFTTLLLSVTAISAFSQPKGIKCIYSSSMEVKKGVYEIENEIARNMVIRDFQEDKKCLTLKKVDS